MVPAPWRAAVPCWSSLTGAHVCCHSAVTSWPSWLQLQREMDLHVSGFLWTSQHWFLAVTASKAVPRHALSFTAGKFSKRGKSRGNEHLGSRMATALSGIPLVRWVRILVLSKGIQPTGTEQSGETIGSVVATLACTAKDRKDNFQNISFI